MTVDERNIQYLHTRNALVDAEKRNEKLQDALLLAKQHRDESRQHEAEAKLELAITKEKLKIYSKAAELLHTERNFCGAAVAYADAKASIEPQANEYKRTLAALQAARRTYA
jgi:hypothetical protein